MNDVLAGRAVSVTHCDMTFCTRVFASKGESPLNIHCGGWTVEHGLTLLVDGVEHRHQSKEIPLTDIPFAVTTWKRWFAAHPNTKVYLGPFAVPREVPGG